MKNKNLALAVVITLMGPLLAYRCGRPPKISPEVEKQKQQKWEYLKQVGDREFHKMYWAGWHKAIPLYESAWEIKKDDQLKQKLFFSYLLLAIREKEFDVFNLESLNKAEILLAEDHSKNLHIYLDIASQIVSAVGLSDKFEIQKTPSTPPEKVEKNISFLKGNSGTDYFYYFYLHYLGHQGGDREWSKYNLERDRFSSEFPESNLRIALGGSCFDLEKALDKSPDFIELLLLQADQLYQAGQYAQARSRYQSILEINPRVPSAFTGIGSIYFWMELYDEAEYHYDRALAITPNFSKALFGKAMCQHYLGEFDLSNALLLRLIENQPLYHGEAYFYRALNHFNLKNNRAVKENIEKAMTFTPDSTDLNAFAGIFYYYLKDVKRAKLHLQKVFEHRVHHPDAYFYSGCIALTEKKPPDDFFIAAARYFWEQLENQQTKLDRVDKLDIKEKLKNKLRANRLRRLKENARDSLEKLNKILMVSKGAKKTFSQISEFYLKIKNLQQNLLLNDSTQYR